jgi:hypothetical protein
MNNKTIIIITLIGLLMISVNAILIDSVLARGDSCINIKWTPNTHNCASTFYYTHGCDIHKSCDFISGNTYTSIAYSYGGDDNYIQFKTNLSNNFLAGSHLCHYQSFGDPTGTATGIDCSAFICYLWDEPRVSTTGLANSYTPILRSNLQPGDILVKSGSHTVFVVDTTSSANVLIWEATGSVNGCRERIIDLNDTYWDSYLARRNNNITLKIQEHYKANNSNNLFTIYPSPFNPTLTISLKGNSEKTIAIYNIRGQLLLTKKLAQHQNSFIWHPNIKLNSGIYIIKGIVAKKSYTTKAILVR